MYIWEWEASELRGNSCKLKKTRILNIRDANMFHNRVINFWNKLPDSVVLLSSFKRLLLSFVVSDWYEHFFCQLDFFSSKYCCLLLLLTLFLWAPAVLAEVASSLGVRFSVFFCIWSWTNKLIDRLIDCRVHVCHSDRTAVRRVSTGLHFISLRHFCTAGGQLPTKYYICIQGTSMFSLQKIDHNLINRVSYSHSTGP